MIWQTTANELKMTEFKEIIRQLIFSQRLSSGTNKIINRFVEAIEVLNSDPVIDKDEHANLSSSCSKSITQYKIDLVSLNLDIIENIKQDHPQQLMDLQNKLTQSNYDETLKQAIINRQEVVRAHHEVYLKHKLNTFFNEAPTMVSNQ